MELDARRVRGWRLEARPGEAGFEAAVELGAALVAARLEPAVTDSGEAGTIRFVALAGVAPGTASIDVAEDAITVAAGDAAGYRAGATWLRERLGLLAVRPGLEVRDPAPGGVARGRHEAAPAFAVRGVVLGCDGLHEAWREWLPFAARNGLNAVFFHDTPPSPLERPAGAARPRTREEAAADGHGWLFTLWEAEGGEIRREAERLGLRLEFGGHHLSSLLPRELFEVHPEWFPERGGERRREHNLCVSAAGALAALQNGAREFFTRFPGMDVYHLWGDDLRAGGWCRCTGCADLSPADQALRATNAIAEVLADVAPGAWVAHLAYHDTIGAPATVVPRENVLAVWAPRNRCYAHAIDAPGCRRNAEHVAQLAALVRQFGGDRVRVFEYYSDGILFKWMAPPHLEVLGRDLAAYRSLGVGGIHNLAVGPRPWSGPTWHAWWFARCAWQGGGDPEAELARFCRASFGEAAAAFAAAYRRVDRACRLLFERGELEPGGRFDVLDYGDTPRGALHAVAERAAEALQEFVAAAAELPLAAPGAGMEAIDELAATVAAGMHLAERVIGWDRALSGQVAEAAEHLRLAEVYLRSLRDWYHAHAGPAYGSLGEWMLRSARWHTDRAWALAGDSSG